MKLALAAVLSVVVVAITTSCAQRITTIQTGPAAPAAQSAPVFSPEPIPSRASLQRYYVATKLVDSTTRDTLTDVVVQANFRNPRVRCSSLDGPPTRLSLTLRRDSSPLATPGALLRVEYQASERLISHGDRSLRLFVNGETLEPVPYADPNRGEAYTRSEVAVYVISTAALRQIVVSDTASARVFGQAGSCEFPITGHARGLMALFMEKELKTTSVASWR
jgi:hypothetical protein